MKILFNFSLLLGSIVKVLWVRYLNMARSTILSCENGFYQIYRPQLSTPLSQPGKLSHVSHKLAEKSTKYWVCLLRNGSLNDYSNKTGTLSAVRLRFVLQVVPNHLPASPSHENFPILFWDTTCSFPRETLKKVDGDSLEFAPFSSLWPKTLQGQTSPHSSVLTVCSLPRRPQRPGRCVPRCITDLLAAASLRAHRGPPERTGTNPL